MTSIDLGLVHTPVTPFTENHAIDFDRYGRLIEFHLRNGADSIAAPMHAGESVSLTDNEQRAVVEFVVRTVAGRVPVVAHVSDAGTTVAVERARHAEKAGATAVLTTTPYYWTPPQPMVIEHFRQIGSAIGIPFLALNVPEENSGSRINADIAMKLVEALPNFVGVIDASLDWQFMLDLMYLVRPVRPDFRLLAGNEYFVSAYSIGASGSVSPLAAIAPRLVRRCHDDCRADRLWEARKAQESLAALRKLLKDFGFAGLKFALQALGRDCGPHRAPVRELSGAEAGRLAATLEAFAPLADEPRGW